MEHQAARRYFARVKRLLVCGRADRKRLLTQFRGLLDTFQQENPEPEYAEIVSAFGEPAACAAALLLSLGEDKLEAARKRRRRIRQGVLTAVVAALVLLSLFWYVQYHKARELAEAMGVSPMAVMAEEFRAAGGSGPGWEWNCALRGPSGMPGRRLPL